MTDEQTPDASAETERLEDLPAFDPDAYKGKTVELTLRGDLVHSAFQSQVNGKLVVVTTEPSPVPASAADDLIKQAREQFGLDLVKEGS